jgi:hypothetical protein
MTARQQRRDSPHRGQHGEAAGADGPKAFFLLADLTHDTFYVLYPFPRWQCDCQSNRSFLLDFEKSASRSVNS